MNIDLTETNASAINAALLDARRRYGSATYGAVLTLVIVIDERGQYDATRAAVTAAREHPARILAVIPRPESGEPRLDAEVRTSGESGPGEVVVLRMYGELADHADSVVLPLLLPDAPVVTWWPGAAPEKPAQDPLGALGGRRITDAAAAPDPVAALQQRASTYTPGDTDLAWTRLTPWRALLASAFDAPLSPVTAARVSAGEGDPGARLLACWLAARLGVPVGVDAAPGSGIAEVALDTAEGPVRLQRTDPRVALFSRPGWPERPVALSRRSIPDLLVEELRRLDADEIYGAVLGSLLAPDGKPGS